MTIFVFSDSPSSAAPCASTIGSLSTYTTARAGRDLLHQVVRVALGGQPGADVDELAHPGSAIHRAGALVERPVRPGRVADLRHQRLSRSPSSRSAAKLLVPPRK